MQNFIKFKLFLTLGVARLLSIIVQSRGAPNPSFTFTCNTISFTRQTGNTQESYRGPQIVSCIDISTVVPTTISMSSESIDNGCSYEVIGYSDSSCQDLNVSSNQPRMEFNQRKAISSYRLQNNPRPKNPVTVKFGGGNFNNEETHVLCQAGCYNLFGTGKGENYPRWVAVYDDRGSIVKREDNYIKLFSRNACQDGTILRYQNGATAMQYNQILDVLTRNSTQFVIGSLSLRLTE